VWSGSSIERERESARARARESEEVTCLGS
jgi:hypothetical protein